MVGGKLEMEKLRYFCNKIIPLVYDESLSYYEFLCKVNGKLNEVINELNAINISFDELKEDILKQSKEYTDVKVSDLNAYVVQKFNDLKTYVDEVDEGTRAWVLVKLNEIVAEGLRIYNPTNGLIQPLAKVLGDVYDRLRYLGITCGEYDSLDLTCEEYDNKDFSCREYDIYVRWKLLKNPDHYMFNPFTGIYETTQEVISYLADFHKPTPITAGEYDSLQLTAGEYDAKELTAYDYDTNGKNLLTA